MKTVLSWFKQRPLRFTGGLLVFFSLGLTVFLVMLDLFAGMPNPYLGVITYMVMPGVLSFGLILVPVDVWIQRRRAARGGPAPLTLDLTAPAVRKIVTFFGISSVLVLVSLTVVAYKGVEYMDTKDFCGRVCHKVMIPELAAYERSSHSSVRCIECHIGPGASWFVRSKLSGFPQVWHYTKGDYPRPLETPVAALRPSRDTCENCHSVQRFYGSRLRTTITYQTDEKNTKGFQSMLMHIGSGGVPGSGIHSHMINEISYLPATKDMKEIAWVKVTRPDGTSQEFVNEAHKDDLPQLRLKQQTRNMDCIDCHNRAAHEFVSFEKMLDDGLTRQTVDPTIPFIKKQAMEAVGDTEKVPTEAEQKAAADRISAIVGYYQKALPKLYAARQKDIERSVAAIRTLYIGSAWPHMKVNAGTYTNWRSHDGCWRCHGTMVATKPGKVQEISQDCNLCHSDQADRELK